MRKQLLTALLLGFTVATATAQTLFTYGNHKVDAGEFLRAFNKNNQQPAAQKSKAMREYLDLYINSRLKIQEAYDRGYDTIPNIRAEVENLRNQIIDNYMSDPAAIDRLTKEAFRRSQKDIRVSHIFIGFRNASGQEDTIAARKKVNEIEARLKKGEDFGALAAQYSDDPSAKSNRGDIGYITVFTLPYELENLAYNTPVGKTSNVFRSRSGFHIFKNTAERKALGKIKAQQILFAIPPNSDANAKAALARLADSVHKLIVKGGDFSKLASTYSNDFVGAASGGAIPDITVGQYEPQFEKVLLALPNAGVSKPFATSHGYHIVKRIAISPVVSSPTDKENQEMLKAKVMADDRWKTAKDFIYAKVAAKNPVRRTNYNEEVLWALSDSLLDFKPVGIGKSMNTGSVLFTIGKTEFKVIDWAGYAQVNRYKADRSGKKSYTELMDEFTRNAMYEEYRNHLEDYNEDFKQQMNEFREGNLFFEIMQQEVWNKAQGDSVALKELYEKNKSRYDWKESAAVVMFFCADETSAKTLAELVKKNPSNWRTALAPYTEKVVADSGRYEWAQIPGLGKGNPKAGETTALTVNPTDNTASFAHIFNVYTSPSPRSFDEARGLVMNDYQAKLEEEWINQLKKKNPVKIDAAVLAKISK